MVNSSGEKKQVRCKALDEIRKTQLADKIFRGRITSSFKWNHQQPKADAPGLSKGLHNSWVLRSPQTAQSGPFPGIKTYEDRMGSQCLLLSTGDEFPPGHVLCCVLFIFLLFSFVFIILFETGTMQILADL